MGFDNDTELYVHPSLDLTRVKGLETSFALKSESYHPLSVRVCRDYVNRFTGTFKVIFTHYIALLMGLLLPKNHFSKILSPTWYKSFFH